jgi:lipopolysaccharide transport system ATP-binding protein
MSSPVIKDKNGDKVNVLITGETYTYNYDIEFNTSAERVSISLGIKTEKGQKIAGASLSNMDDCIETVIEGEKYLVKWSFKCNFLTGFYYSDNGVSALIESKRAFLTKSIDAHVFKVEKKKNNISARIVDLDQKIKLEKYPIS